jgi:hypothetical protein
MSGRRISIWVLATALVAVPASAELFTVSLQNGTTFESLYRPEEAPWDTNKVLVRTDVGNWISIAKSDIASVVSETEVGGFGTVIDNSTIELGFSANDAPTPEQLAEQAKANPLAALQAQQPEQTPYTIQQFVNPSQTQGIPAGYLGFGNNVQQVPQLQPAPPPRP